MGDYKRLISYIYSYEKGVKTKNSGFAKIETRNGICKINISLRISDMLMNEAEDNALEVFLFCRKNGRIEKALIGRMRIISGCSVFKIQINSDKIGNHPISLSEITGIFICSRAFLHKNSQLGIIYASEWDDIPIDIEAFTEETHIADDDKGLQDEESKGYNEKKDIIFEQGEIKASEQDETGGDMVNPAAIPQEQEISPGEVPQTNVDTGSAGHEEKITKAAEIAEWETETESKGSFGWEAEGESLTNREVESEDFVKPITEASTEEKPLSGKDTGFVPGELDAAPDCESCKKQLQEMLTEEQSETVRKKAPDTGDYFKMLCNCYPKIKVDEIEGECIKITPHDISYLPKKYWHLCNNSFLLHGFYNYKYLLFCEKITDNVHRYMICVPGMFHNKEQTMAKMFGFTEFEGGKQNGMVNFGYWCMYL